MPPALPIRAFQWDLARQVERLDWLIAQLPRYAAWGYGELYLHLEDAVEYPSLPGVARRDAYSRRQFGRLVEAAARAGIGVVPVVNLLGHARYLLKRPEFRDLSELRAPDGSALPSSQLCPLHPRTLEVADRLLGDVAPFCTAGKVHVGLDESYLLGRHPLSRAEIARRGLAAHFAGHVSRLHGLAQARRLRLGLWADMLALLPAAIPLLPPDVVAYDWYYYPFRGRPRIEARNFAAYDLAQPLRARGIEHWGCPMNGSFRLEPLPRFRERLANIADWWSRVRRTGAAGLLVTSWEPSRLAAEVPLLVDAAAAGLWLDGEAEGRRLWEKGCRRVYGAAGPRVARALWAADRHPFLGYAKWQANERWDGAAGARTEASARAEARACRALAARPGLPAAPQASLRFRAYLAERDRFVQQAARGSWRLRAALFRNDRAGARLELAALERAAAAFASRAAAGRRAARALWRLTRDRGATGPNERTVGRDCARLRAWRAWLRRCARRPASAWTASPVLGAWQLLLRVKNFAPALQKLAVEEQMGPGRWQERLGLFLIEFQARSARPRARVEHTISVPVSRPSPLQPIRLRIAVRGLGRLKIGPAVLTDGVRRRAVGPPGKILGKAAARAGLPEFEWATDRGRWDLVFPPDRTRALPRDVGL